MTQDKLATELLVTTVVPRKRGNTRDNNFDLIRLALSLSVFALHAASLSAVPSLHLWALAANLSFTDVSLDEASLAVECFFVISGYLIFKSYEEGSGLTSYIRKRALRIYPAYAVVIITTALLCTALTSLPVATYFAGPFWKYVGSNLIFATFLYPRIPGVFASNPGLTLINGALWTIKVEVMFYCVVPVIAYLYRRLPMFWLTFAIYSLSFVWRTYFVSVGEVQMSSQLPRQMSFFISGAICYYKRDWIFANIHKLVLPCLAVFLIEHNLGYKILLPFALTILVLYVSYCAPMLLSFRPRWDLSYGIYIMHFPILQWFISIGFLSVRPNAHLLFVLFVVIALASLSWLYIEKPMLRKKTAW